MPSMRKTKIVCTLGPTAESEATLRELAAAGMNVARLNMSHGEHDVHESRIRLLRKINRELANPITLLMDTQGPEIRTGVLNEPLELKTGDIFCFYPEGGCCDGLGTSVSYPGLAKAVKPGDRLLLDDGMIEFRVASIQGRNVICKVMNNGKLISRKSMAIPGKNIDMKVPTPKDIDDIDFGLKHGVDFIAVSFVRSGDDIGRIRNILERKGSHAKVIAKIEHADAVKNFDAILRVSDGIMIARGDLGLRVPLEDVPLIQAEIIRKCNEAGKPVITATHMLNSMIESPRPTRAEVSDVATSVLSGTDCVMLSAETANGKFPVQSVRIMDRICRRAEQAVRPKFSLIKESEGLAEVASRAVAHSADILNAAVIITFVSSGATAGILSRYRIKTPIYAITFDHKQHNILSLFWGVYHFQLEGKFSTNEEMISQTTQMLLKKRALRKGDTVVMISRVPVGWPSIKSLMEIATV